MQAHKELICEARVVSSPIEQLLTIYEVPSLGQIRAEIHKCFVY